MPGQSYRDLHVWQRAMDLAIESHTLAHLLRGADDHALAEELERHAVRIPANIADGSLSEHRTDHVRHLSEAFGALRALETYLLIADRLCLLGTDKLRRAYVLADEVSRMLYGLRRSIQNSRRASAPVPVVADSIGAPTAGG